VGRLPLTLTNHWWRLDAFANIERFSPDPQAGASTVCRIYLRLLLPLPAESIGHQSDQERGPLRLTNNLPADGSDQIVS
jgi:hypothetical protein